MTHSIVWSDNISENVIIELYRGTSLQTVINNSTPSSGSYNWTVPTSLVADANYRIKISSVNNNNINDYSDYFEIMDGSSLEVTSPATGNDWKKGTTQQITWSDNISENVIIELYKGSSLEAVIVNSVPSNGSYSWNVPTTLTAGINYRIKITSINDNNLYDFSGFFSISQGTGVNSISAGKIEVYPNPAREFILISTSNIPAADYRLRLINPIGQLLFEDQLKGVHLYRLDLGSYAPGVYRLQLEAGQNRSSATIIIQK
jgi:TolB-like protein